MASPDGSLQPKKKKKRTKSKKEEQGQAGVFDWSAITVPAMNLNMNGQPYMNNMSMPMAVTSPTQQMQFGGSFMPYPSATQPTPTATPMWVNELMSKFEAISVKINTIDEIKSSVNSIDTKMTAMRRDLNTLTTRVNEVETSQSFISKTFDDHLKNTKETNKTIESEMKKLKSECVALRTEIASMKAETKIITESKKEITKIVKANEKLNSDIEVIQRESMRDNLLFHGIKESTDEDCVAIVKEICQSKLEIEDDFNIKTAFRLGKVKRSENEDTVQNKELSRPILVKFSDRQKRDSVRRKSFRLKGSDISITDHFPKTVVDKRRSLIPFLKQARDAEVKAVLIRDKLFIGGVVYSGGSIEDAIKEATSQKMKIVDKNKNKSHEKNASDASGATGGPDDNAMT